MPQYTFPLQLPPVFLEDNFCVAPCNQDAHGWILRWPQWPANTLIVYGASGSGKSHLGHVWAGRAKARVFFGKDKLPLTPQAMRGNWLIEDIDYIKNERALLHLLNFSRENKNWLLFTASQPPKQLPFTLSDLTSRLLALPSVGISAPDEDTLAAVLRKQFSDRQLKIEDGAIAYLVPRMERSYAGAATVVKILDEQALAEQRNLTIPFIKRALGY